MRTFRWALPTDHDFDNERGAVLVTVLVMILAFAILGGGVIQMTRLYGGYEKNREWALQAGYAAEAGVHKAVTNIMLSPDTSNYNTSSFTDAEIEPGYPATMDAIIERVPATSDFRIYGRGRAGTNWRAGADAKPVTKYLRVYIRANGLGYDKTVSLWDWQEITEDTVRAHRDAISATDPVKAAEFTAWLGE